MSGFEDQARIRRFLLPGERIVWTGRPPQGMSFHRQDLWSVPLALLCGLFFLWLNARLGSDGDGPGRLADIVGILVGLALGAGRALHDWWLRRRLVYAVTNQRVLILRDGAKGRLRSHDLAWLPLLELEQRGARGTIFIEAVVEPGGWIDNLTNANSPLLRGFSFVGIDQPQAVYDLICRETRQRRVALADDLLDRIA